MFAYLVVDPSLLARCISLALRLEGHRSRATQRCIRARFLDASGWSDPHLHPVSSHL